MFTTRNGRCTATWAFEDAINDFDTIPFRVDFASVCCVTFFTFKLVFGCSFFSKAYNECQRARFTYFDGLPNSICAYALSLQSALKDYNQLTSSAGPLECDLKRKKRDK